MNKKIIYDIGKDDTQKSLFGEGELKKILLIAVVSFALQEMLSGFFRR